MKIIFKPIVILFAGAKHSGKNTAATWVSSEIDRLPQSVPKFELAYADKLKNNTAEDFSAVAELIEDVIDRIKDPIDRQTVVDNLRLKLSDPNYKNPLQRILYQIYGTEIFRKRVDNNYWIRGVRDQIQSTIAMFQTPVIFMVTDARFPNEVINGIDFDTYVIRINRPSLDTSDTHESEMRLPDALVDYEIDNDSDLDTFQERVLATFNDIIADHAVLYSSDT